MKNIAGLNNLELLTPASLLGSFKPDEKMRGVTKLTIALTPTDQRIEIRPGFKYVSLIQP